MPQPFDGQVGEHAVEKWALRLKVEAFDVEQPAVAALHDDRNSAGAGVLARQDLNPWGVAFLDEDIDRRRVVEELIDVGLVEPALIDAYVEIGIDLDDLASGEHRLVDAEIADR